MIKHVICLRDIKGGVYNDPRIVTSIGAAIRDLADLVNSDKDDNVVRRHPEDFELWQLGKWDDETGEFIPYERKCLAIASNLIHTRN